jgi:hypothetical protein
MTRLQHWRFDMSLARVDFFNHAKALFNFNPIIYQNIFGSLDAKQIL